MDSNKNTFIQEARKQQIIEATITPLDDIGYVKASLAQIAKRASISTGNNFLSLCRSTRFNQPKSADTN